MSKPDYSRADADQLARERAQEAEWRREQDRVRADRLLAVCTVIAGAFGLVVGYLIGVS